MTIEELEQCFRDWVYLNDTNALRVVLATAIINMCPTDPLWLFLIAPPSSLKTEIIGSLGKLNFVYPLSSLTPKTFVSGFVTKDGRESLLFKLNNKVVTFKDFTTVISMRNEDKSEILSQLREIYDGGFIKAFGTKETIAWEGKIGLIAGVTPIIDTHYSVYQAMGERFIQCRMETQEPIKACMMAMRNTGQENKMRNELKDKVKMFVDNAIANSFVTPNMISEEYQMKLSHLAYFCVTARTHVPRDRNREIINVQEPESPPRFAKQLQLLSIGLCLVNGSKEMGEEEYDLVFKVAMDCLTPTKKRIILKMFEVNRSVNSYKLCELLRIPSSTILHTLENLEALKIVNRVGNMDMFELSDETKNSLKNFHLQMYI